MIKGVSMAVLPLGGEDVPERQHRQGAITQPCAHGPRRG